MSQCIRCGADQPDYTCLLCGREPAVRMTRDGRSHCYRCVGATAPHLRAHIPAVIGATCIRPTKSYLNHISEHFHPMNVHIEGCGEFVMARPGFDGGDEFAATVLLVEHEYTWVRATALGPIWIYVPDRPYVQPAWAARFAALEAA